MGMTTITVNLSERLNEYLERKVRTGLYKSKDEIIIESLREKVLNELKKEIAERGITRESFEELRKEAGGDIAREIFGKTI